MSDIKICDNRGCKAPIDTHIGGAYYRLTIVRVNTENPLLQLLQMDFCSKKCLREWTEYEGAKQ